MLAAAGLGLIVVIALIVHSGAAEVGQAMALVGWGLIPISLFHLVPMWLSAMSWREMLPNLSRPGISSLTEIRWIRESINSLLPVAGVGGDVVCARLTYLRGVPAPAAAASMVVDITVGVITQLGFVVIALVLLLLRSTEPIVLSIAGSVLAGLGVFVVAIATFVTLQHKGLFAISAALSGAALRGAWLKEVSGHAAKLDGAVREIYRDRPALWRATVWRLAGWVAGTGEIWLTMYAFGAPISLGDAIILEGLSAGIRAAAFMVPGALGLLEGGFVVFGAALGIPATTALVISLTKRVRELGLGLPGLIAWHYAEARPNKGRHGA